MALSSRVTHDQFVIRSELEAFHTPTGAVFHGYPYANPTDMLQSVKVSWGRTGTPSDTEYAEHIRLMASRLLLEQVCRAYSTHRFGNVA